jgi:hypothetical protein
MQFHSFRGAESAKPVRLAVPTIAAASAMAVVRGSSSSAIKKTRPSRYARSVVIYVHSLSVLLPRAGTAAKLCCINMQFIFHMSYFVK